MNANIASAPSTGNARVSLTGYATASAWAYFGFEHADWFDSWRGRALFLPLHIGSRALIRLSPLAGYFTQTLYWRHVWFSRWLAAQSPSIAIEIGAGLSARGISHTRIQPHCRWVDYDLPGMVSARQRYLRGRTLPSNYRLAAGDLLDASLGSELDLDGVDGAAAVMTEGVIDYLDAQEKARAFQTIAGLLRRAGGGRYLFEVHTRDRLKASGRYTDVLLQPLQRIVGRDLFSQLFDDSDHACQALVAAGFTEARVLPDAERFDAHRAPADQWRAFTLIEGRI